MVNTDLTRYTENFCTDNRYLLKAENNELREKMSKVSSKIQESISCEDPKGWWVPISFYNKKNGNNRIYNRKLWENVINNQKDIYVGAPMLADHPEGDSDGSPKDICGIWLDAKIGAPNSNGIGLVYGLLVPSGRLGADLKDHLMNGMKIGTSSSGFGKLMSDGCTVDPDSYMIERLADFVLNPSQGTFFSYDESDDNVVDHSKYNENLNKENIEMDMIIKEKTVKDSKLTKLEEKKFRRDMESFLESAESIGDPQERLKEYEDIKSYLEDGACPDLKEKVEQKIAEQEEFIKTALKEKIELKEELEIESPKDLKIKLTKIAEDAAILDQDAKEWKKVAEKLQEKYNSTKEELNNRHTDAFVEYQKNKISSLEKELESQVEKSKSLLKDLYEAYSKVKEELECSNEACDELTKQKEECEAALEESNKKLEKETSLREALEKSTLELTEKLKESEETSKKYVAVISKQREAIEKSVDVMNTLKEKTDTSKKLANDYARNLKSAETFIAKKEREERLEEQARLTDTSVHQYYEALYKSYGNDIVPFKKLIIGSKTLTEAKNKFFKEIINELPQSKKIDAMRMPESVSVSAEKRAEALGKEKFGKESVMNRIPKGWY